MKNIGKFVDYLLYKENRSLEDFHPNLKKLFEVISKTQEDCGLKGNLSVFKEFLILAEPPKGNCSESVKNLYISSVIS